MNREILFRGKRVDNGEWVEGDLTGEFTIHTQPPWIDGEGSYEWWGYEVIPETVGQFTGLTDKNGKKIFEGDIVKSAYFENAVVEFWEYQWSFKSEVDSHHSFRTASHTFEVTGSIHDK
jgi:hypothetical protein